LDLISFLYLKSFTMVFIEWSIKIFFGTPYLRGGDEDSAMMVLSPSIQMSGADDLKKMWPEANAIITIFYK